MNTKDMNFLRRKAQQWEKTLSAEPDYLDGVCCSDREMYGGAVKDFLKWLSNHVAARKASAQPDSHAGQG